MLLGYLGLSMSFLVVVILLLIILIRPQTRFGLKLAIIPLIIWYAFVMYFIPVNFTGWAREAEPEDRTLILATWVEEPSAKSKGGIYIWGIDYPSINQLVKFSAHPKEFSKFIHGRVPRSYKLPYDKERHKELLELQKNQDKDSIMQYRKGKGKGKKKDGGNDPEDKSGFLLRKLEELLPKPAPAPMA